jgi:hypothetical protein
MFIRLEQERLTIFKVTEQFLVLGGAHLAPPNRLGSVKIRFIINPFIKSIVFWRLVAERLELNSCQERRSSQSAASVFPW